jgi:hypothetical protein
VSNVKPGRNLHSLPIAVPTSKSTKNESKKQISLNPFIENKEDFKTVVEEEPPFKLASKRPSQNKKASF